MVAGLMLALLTLGACSDDNDPSDNSDASATTVTADSPSDAADTTAGDTTADAPADGDRSVRLTEVARLDQPLALVPRSTTTSMYAAEKAGKVWALRRSGDRFERADTPLLDIVDEVGEAEGERGLLGIAFSPDGTTLYANYTDSSDDGATVIARWTLESATSEVVDTASRTEILRQPQPFANHNGGNLVFGPDGHLYVGFGDGGSQGDPQGNGQNMSTLLAKLVRIDPAAPDTPQIVAIGLRNPWRFSFDRATGDLWIGDVGANAWEEVDTLAKEDLDAIVSGAAPPANFGWSLREGRHDTDRPGERPANLIDPVLEYSHDNGVSVIGGYVYRGSEIPSLVGTYLFTDLTQSTLRTVPEGLVTTTGDTPGSIASFGEDIAGELYLVSLEGAILAVRPA